MSQVCCGSLIILFVQVIVKLDGSNSFSTETNKSYTDVKDLHPGRYYSVLVTVSGKAPKDAAFQFTGERHRSRELFFKNALWYHSHVLTQRHNDSVRYWKRKMFPNNFSTFYLDQALCVKIFIVRDSTSVRSLNFMPAFPLGRVAGQHAALGGLEVRHGFQKFYIVLLSAQLNGTKQGRRRNHATRSFANHHVTFSWV